MRNLGYKKYAVRLCVMTVALVFSVGNVVNAEKQFKGTEVYPWKLNGQLVFTVLPGTNRLKTCEEVRNAKVAVAIDQLEKRLSKLDAGEYVFFVTGNRLEGCALAELPAKVKKRLTKFAASKKLEISL